VTPSPSGRSSQIIFHSIKNSIGDFELPKVSFIIPTLNSERTLERCLKSIVAQEYPSIEIIIVDGGSTDNTIDIAKRYNTHIFKFKGRLGAARQLGVDHSSGELIANWDSDIYIPDKGWLRRAVQTLLSYPNASTLWVRNTYPPDSTIVQKAFLWYGWEMMLNFAKKGRGFWGGGNSIFRKQMIEEVGGFDTEDDTGEDFNLAKNLSLKGYKVIVYNDYVYHDTFRSLSELLRKDVRRARNFNRVGINKVMGVSIKELLLEHIKVGILSIKNLIVKREMYFVLVPIIVFCRLITYGLIYMTY
jgi:glycosyltransferase involved in cell wall biosynthesis